MHYYTSCPPWDTRSLPTQAGHAQRVKLPTDLRARDDVLLRVIRDPSPAQAGLVGPLGGRLGFPCPEHPTLGGIFVYLGLGVKIFTEEFLVLAAGSAMTCNAT